MVRLAKSEAVKALIRQQARTESLRKAVAAYKRELESPSEQRKKSIRDVALLFGVAPSTLSDHINNKHRFQRDYLDSRQKLRPVQEQEVVRAIKTLDEWGMPPMHAEIERMLLDVLNRGKRGASVTIGKRYADAFLRRHHNEISSGWESPLDRKRTDGLNPTSRAQHFQCVERTTNKYQIIPENDYGMDESPIMLGVAAKARTYGRKKTKLGKRVKQKHARRDGNREGLTIIEPIRANGESLTPTIILRGKSFKREWGGAVNNPIGAHICISENGYTDNYLSLQWLKQFDEQTKALAGGRFRRLLVDGHKSHCSLAFLKYAAANKIVVVAYPPHCTHALQGLDVVIFARIKVLWAEKLRELSLKDEKVTKYNFIRIYAQIREKALTRDNIKAAFRATGIWPFNPAVITDDQLGPSRTTSTESTGPTSLPEHLQDICDAIKAQRIRSNHEPDSNGEMIESSRGQEMVNGSPNCRNQISVPKTPERIATHLGRITRGTALEYIGNPNPPSFSSETAIPDLFLSPTRMQNPCHRHFYLPPSDIDDLSTEDAKHHLKLALAHLKHQEDKIDSLETNLLVMHRYCGSVHAKLYAKEHKEIPETDRLAANGERDMTHPAWIAAEERAVTGRERKEKLIGEYRAWNEAEKASRKAAKEKIDADWLIYKAPYKAAHKRPPGKKPAYPKRPETPQQFWEIRPKRNVSGAVDSDVEDEEEDE